MSQPLAHAHECLAEFIHANARTVSPERVFRLGIHEICGEGTKKQSAQVSMLLELEV